jgi:hypothetical protein
LACDLDRDHPQVGEDDYQADATLEIVDLLNDPEDGSH